MMALADEQASNYNANNRESGQAFYDDEDELLTIITNEAREFSFEIGQDIDVRDAKECGIYEAFVKVAHDFDDHE